MKTKERAGVVGFDTNNELDHLYCCNEDLALCGANIADYDDIEDELEYLCVVCGYLDNTECKICGG